MITLARIRDALETHQPRRVPLGGQRAAAVLVPLFERQPGGTAHVLLTRRSETMSTHRGQVSFPGGTLDSGESVRAGALREAHEEVGLDPARVQIVGELDDCPTFVTGFLISPVVGVIEPGAFSNASTAEIAELLELPLDGFVADGALRTEWRTIPPEAWQPDLLTGVKPGESVPVHFYTVEGKVVWGATARILHGLLELLR